MAYSAVAAELHSQRFYILRHDDDLHFFILPLYPKLPQYRPFPAAADPNPTLAT
jgi:hypothetical protein